MSNSNLTIKTTDDGGREATLTGEVIEVTVGIENVWEGIEHAELDRALIRVIAAQFEQLGIEISDGQPLAPGPLDLVWDVDEEGDQS